MTTGMILVKCLFIFLTTFFCFCSGVAAKENGHKRGKLFMWLGIACAFCAAFLGDL